MTRRIAASALCLAACALALNAAADSDKSKDTLWDVLRKAEATAPAKEPARAEEAGTLWDLLRTPGVVEPIGQKQPAAPTIDPASGKPPAHARKPRGGFYGFFDSIGNGFRRLGKSLNSEVRVTGMKNMGWHMESVSGSGETYQNDRYWGQRGLGGAYDMTDLNISGKVFGLFNFETRYSNSLFNNPNDNRLSLNYSTRKLKVDAGDITGSLQGNSLLDFSRTLKGLQVSGEISKGVTATALYSQTKAQTHTLVLQGANTSGPYYVFAGQVVDGSERVRVNNREMVKGEDYTLDPYTGELKFKDGFIVQYDDVIAVTFETYGYNSNPGLLTGGRLDFALPKNMRAGWTYITQLSSRDRGAPRARTDQFAGYENPTTPYTLDSPVELIIEKDAQGNITKATPKFPMVVTVGGIPQVYETDYFVDPLLPNRVFFRLPIPSTQIIKITYIPASTGDSPGDRNVMGFDLRMPLGKKGSISGEWAASRLSLNGNNITGGAKQLRGDMKFLGDKLGWSWSLRDIDDRFTAIESPGFRRNERGLTNTFTYQASKDLRLNLTHEKAKRPSYNYGAFGSGGFNNYAPAVGMDDFNQINLGAIWQINKTSQLNFQSNSMDTKMFNGGSSRYATDRLSFGQRLGAFSYDLSLGRNSSSSKTFYNVNAGGESAQQLNTYGSSSITRALNMTWKAHERLTLQGVLSSSDVNSGTRSQKAQDMQLNANANPLRNVTLRIGITRQDSGGYSPFAGTTPGGATNNTPGTTTGGDVLAPTRQGLPTSGGLYGGIGAYNPYTGSTFGGGFNSGLGSYGNYSGGFYNPSIGLGLGSYSYGGKSNGVNVGIDYQPFPNLNLSLTMNRSASEGDLQYNSRRNDMGLQATYNLGEKLSLSAMLSRQRVDYLGNQGGTSSNLMFFTVSGKPLGKLGTTFSYQLMKTASSFNQTGTGTGTGGFGQLPGGLGYLPGYSYGFGTGGTDLRSYSLRLDYPVWRGNSIFMQLDNADSSGYLASVQRTMIVGFEFPITQTMAFSLGWRDQSSATKGDAASGIGNYSYRARSLDVNLNMRFQ